MRIARPFAFIPLLTLSFLPTATLADSTRTPSNPSLTLQKALIELKEGHKADAYRRLEAAYPGETSISLKAEFALLLSVGDPNLLKNPRAEYAKFALEHLPDLSGSDRFRLLRIEGDSAFESSRIPEAKLAYQEALHLADVSESDQEYVTYKLGWVNLNEKRPDLAYGSWLQWVVAHPKGELRESFIKDLGKSFVESTYSSTGFKPEFPLVLSGKEAAAFVEGLRKGILREGKPDLSVLRARLQSSPAFAEIVNRLLDDGELFAKQTCSVLPWVEAADPLRLKPETLKPWLGSCGKSLEKDLKKSGSLKSPEFKRQFKYQMAALASVYLKLPAAGADRLPRAHALELAGRTAESCGESIRAFEETLHSGHLPDAEWLAPIRSQCAASITSAQTSAQTAKDAEPAALIPAFVRSLLQSKAIAQATIAPGSRKLWLSALNGLIGLPQFMGPLTSELPAQKTLWKDSELPLLVIEASSGETRQALLRVFSPVPATGPYRGMIASDFSAAIKKGDYASAYELLSTYLPLNQVHGLEDLRLWSLVLLSSPKEFQSSRALPTDDFIRRYELAVHSVPAAQMEDQDARALLYFWVERGQWDAFWRNYAWIRKIVASQPEIQKAAADQYFKIKNMATLTPLVEHSRPDPLADYLIESHLLMTEQMTELTTTAPRKFLPAPASVRTTGIYQDLNTLVEIRRLEPEYSALQFQPGPKLNAALTRRVLGLKKIFERLEKRRWASEITLESAHRSLNRLADTLSDRIARIQTGEPEEQQQLALLSQTVRQWRLQ